MKSPLTLLAIVTICALVAMGCNSDTANDTPPAEPAEQAEPGAEDSAGMSEATIQVVYCGKCGHVADSEACCDEDCMTCECGFHKGADLCCKDVEAGVNLCAKCGHAAGSAECCTDECEVCTKCGMHQGSPLCCKLVATEKIDESAGG